MQSHTYELSQKEEEDNYLNDPIKLKTSSFAAIYFTCEHIMLML